MMGMCKNNSDWKFSRLGGDNLSSMGISMYFSIWIPVEDGLRNKKLKKEEEKAENT